MSSAYASSMAVFVDVQVNQARLKVQGQRGPVADRFFKAVAAHVAVFVFLGTKGVEGVAVAPVDGGAGQTKEEGVGQRRPHLHAQVPFLGAVGFIDQHNQVVAVVEDAVGFGEFEDGGDDDFARVLLAASFPGRHGCRL